MKKKIILLLSQIILCCCKLDAQCYLKNFYSELLNHVIVGFNISPEGVVACRHTNGLSVYDGTSWHIHRYNFFGGNSIEIGKNNTFWLGTYNEGLIRFIDSSHVTIFDTSDGLASMSIGPIEIAPNGYVWFGYEDASGVSVFNGTTFKNYDTTDGLASMVVGSLEIAPDGKIWVTHSDAKGVSVFNGLTFTAYDTSDGLSVMSVNDLGFDKYGKVYLANRKDGTLDVFDGKGFSKILLPESGAFSDITVAENGDIYISYLIAANEYKFYKWSGGKWSLLNLTKLGINPEIIEFFTDHANHFYVATDKGLLKYDGVKEEFYDSLFVQKVKEIGVISNGTIYALLSNGSITEFKQSSSFAVEINQPFGSTYDGKILVFLKTNGIRKFNEVFSQPFTSAFNYLTVNTTGDFLLNITPDKSVNPDFISTYYGNSDQWTMATIISKHFCHEKADTYHIDMIVIPPQPKGKGYISGTIKVIEGLRAGTQPIKDVDVTLKKVPGGVIVKNTKTNDQGFYEFAELDTAAYAIFIDIPGLPQDSPRIVKITATDTSFKNQDYKVDSNGIKASDFTSVREKRNDLEARIYPNPFSNILIINYFNYDQTRVEVINMSGQVISSFKNQVAGETNLIIDFTPYPTGLYLIKIYSGNKLSLFRVNHQ